MVNVLTQLLCTNVKTNVPVFGFHILALKSAEPDAKLPSNNVVNEITLLVCPVNVKTNVPVFGFHILTVLSFKAEPDAKLPFDNVANLKTLLVCPVNV